MILQKVYNKITAGSHGHQQETSATESMDGVERNVCNTEQTQHMTWSKLAAAVDP